MLQALADTPRVWTRLPVELGDAEILRQRTGARVGSIELGCDPKAPPWIAWCSDRLDSHRHRLRSSPPSRNRSLFAMECPRTIRTKLTAHQTRRRNRITARIAVLLLGRNERRKLHSTRRTPCAPEGDDDRVTPGLPKALAAGRRQHRPSARGTRGEVSKRSAFCPPWSVVALEIPTRRTPTGHYLDRSIG